MRLNLHSWSSFFPFQGRHRAQEREDQEWGDSGPSIENWILIIFNLGPRLQRYVLNEVLMACHLRRQTLGSENISPMSLFPHFLFHNEKKMEDQCWPVIPSGERKQTIVSWFSTPDGWRSTLDLEVLDRENGWKTKSVFSRAPPSSLIRNIKFSLLKKRNLGTAFKRIRRRITKTKKKRIRRLSYSWKTMCPGYER